MNRNDLHFHLLPGIDDGPATLDESLYLAAQAVADGTTTIVATPHIRPAYVTDVRELRERIVELRAALHREGIRVEVQLGGEIAHGMVGRLEQHEFETIAQGPPGGKWVLLEAPFLGFDETFHDAAQEVRDRGFGVLIAHPERSAGARRNPTAIRREVLRGSALQLNVWSLAGRHGTDAREAGLALISDGLATVVASDAHADWRRPLLSRAMTDLAHAGVDQLTIRTLACTGPRRLLECGIRTRQVAFAA